MANFPVYKTGLVASWENIGDVDEELKITWVDDQGFPGVHHIMVGTDAFLESPVNTSQVPDDQLLCSIRMAAILGGEVLPGTQEYLDVVDNQGTRYFQTIIGNIKIKTVTSVVDATYGPLGTVFDLEFQKVGAATNVKTVRTDAWTLSQYNNGSANYAYAACVIPGMLHKVHGFKKSDLGASGSANRNAVIATIAAQKFWI
jgi:hypothetical protein